MTMTRPRSRRVKRVNLRNFIVVGILVLDRFDVDKDGGGVDGIGIQNWEFV
jgi:hypothetical protein